MRMPNADLAQGRVSYLAKSIRTITKGRVETTVCWP